MMRNYKLERLLAGETFETSEKGNSMSPLITSGQKHLLAPVNWEDCEPNDIVYCKVNGRFYTHLVKSKNTMRGLLIGNNQGRINGWTKQVFGKVIKVLSLALLLSSCTGNQYDGLILVDPETGTQYMLDHSVGDTYFVKRGQMRVINSDTTFVFSND